MDEFAEIERLICAIDNLPTPEAVKNERHRVVEMIKRLCAKDVEAYPLYALTAASDDWKSMEIARPELFREILLQGIDKGCLNPDADYAWEILAIAAEKNDPATFMDDLERFYDILSTAVENGAYAALDIMNQIWEPEQIVEED